MHPSPATGWELPWCPAWHPLASQHSIHVCGFNPKPSAVGPTTPFELILQTSWVQTLPYPQQILLLSPEPAKAFPSPLLASLGFPIMKCPPTLTSSLSPDGGPLLRVACLEGPATEISFSSPWGPAGCHFTRHACSHFHTAQRYYGLTVTQALAEFSRHL